jgi:FlaA1/EpsC-like NDP-sugar epimerase
MQRLNNNPFFQRPSSYNPADLLEREPICLDQQNIAAEIRASTVLITGAAGSIGSELAVQIGSYCPERLILVDQSETMLHELEIRLRQEFKTLKIDSYVANITDVLRMAEIFSQSTIHTVFHAAAYKHVPVMEKHPYEAIKTNVFGTEILADLAIAYHIRKFVFISTDKAVKPASVMGASKRLAEIYLQHVYKNHPSATRFIITRFGNVLGSNGSFLTTFERQIRAGGPVTITHPDVRRYVMTISEACQLVLEASASSEGNEILFFDMGEPLLIVDIARKMIQLAGLSLEDIPIEYIGMRPGEKLTEDLFGDHTGPTSYHRQIRKAGFTEIPDFCIKKVMSALLTALDSGRPDHMVSVLKKAIPDYISINSHFGRLDNSLHEKG